MENNTTPSPTSTTQPSPSPSAAPTPTPPPPTPSPVTTPPPSNNSKGSKLPMIIIIVLVLVCIALLGFIAYNTLIKPDNTVNNNASPQPTAITPTPFDQPETPTPSATDSAQTQIQTALAAKDYDSLKPLMAPLVNFEVEASEGVPAGDPDETAENLDYLNTANPPWNFDQANPNIMNVKSSLPDEYGDLYIGIASNDVLAAFGFDENSMIDTIKVAVTYELLIQQ